MAEDDLEFRGFSSPEQNWYKMPNEFTELAASLVRRRMTAVVILLLYVMRHTWGFQEYGIPKKITLDEFINGRKLANGLRMDSGTGLSDLTIRSAINDAVKVGVLVMEVDDHDKGRVKRYFRLRMADDETQVRVLKFNTQTDEN